MKLTPRNYVGQYIKEQLLLRDITTQVAAEKSNVSKTVVIKIKNSIEPVNSQSNETILKIFSAFDLSKREAIDKLYELRMMEALQHISADKKAEVLKGFLKDVL